MILKLAYQDAIYRISEPPVDLEGLHKLIRDTFGTRLPEKITVSYSITGEAENVPVSNEQDYQNLISKQSSKAAKVFIREDNEERKPSESLSEDYGVISPNEKTREVVEERKLEEPNKRDLGELVQNISESVVVPQVQKYPYISNAVAENQDENIRKIVKEVLQSQLPFIIYQVKDAVLKELRPLLQANKPVQEPPKKQQIHLDNEEKIEINPVPSEVIFERSEEVYGREEVPRQPVPVEAADKVDILDKMKKLGNALKDQLVVLPGKAKDAFDDFSQKLEGDPYVVIDGEKFPKSVVDKVNSLKEIFPEEDTKLLLHFVKKYPRNVNLEQLANLYLVKDEPQEGEEGQNQA